MSNRLKIKRKKPAPQKDLRYLLTNYPLFDRKTLDEHILELGRVMLEAFKKLDIS